MMEGMLPITEILTQSTNSDSSVELKRNLYLETVEM